MKTACWYVVYLAFEGLGMVFGMAEVVVQRARYHLPGWR